MSYLTPPANFYQEPGTVYDPPLRDLSDHLELYNDANAQVTTISTDGTMVLDSDAIIPTQKAVRSFVGASPPIGLAVPLILQSSTTYQLELQQLGKPGMTTFGHTVADCTEIADANGVHFNAGTKVYADDTTDTSGIGVGSVQFLGGLSVAKSLSTGPVIKAYYSPLVYIGMAVDSNGYLTLSSTGGKMKSNSYLSITNQAAQFNAFYDATHYASFMADSAGFLEVTTSHGTTHFNDITDTLLRSDGSVTLAGGVGIAKALSSGTPHRLYYDDLNYSTIATDASGHLSLSSSGLLTQIGATDLFKVLNVTDAISRTSAASTVAGGLAVAMNLVAYGLYAWHNGVAGAQLHLAYGDGGAESTFYSNASGALLVTPANGQTCSIDSGSPFRVNNVTDAGSLADAAASAKILGGLTVAKKLWAGDSINGTSISLISTTIPQAIIAYSALIGVTISCASTGGVTFSIAGGDPAFMSYGFDKRVECDATTDATTISTGSLVTSGGLGLAKSLFMGGKLIFVNVNDAINIGVTAVGANGARSIAMGWSTALNGLSDYSIAIGSEACATVSTTGSGLVAVGRRAMYGGNTATDSVAVGTYALYGASTSNHQIAIGYRAQYGGVAVANATECIAIGTDTLYVAAVAGRQGDIAIGQQALNGLTSGAYNVGIGVNALQVATTGSYNVALGGSAGTQLTVGSDNIAIGRNTFLTTSTCSNTVCIGAECGHAGVSGSFNTFIGYEIGNDVAVSGAANVAIGKFAFKGGGTSNYVIAIGQSAMYLGGTGDEDICIGHQAGYNLTSGALNDLIGYRAGYNITTGSDNVCLGASAGYNVTTAINAIAIGTQSMYTNPTTGTDCIAIGTYACTGGSTGSYSIAIGSSSMYSGGSGDYNVSMGYQAGYSLTTGAYNQFIGNLAGYNVTTGVTNMCFGSGAGQAITTGGGNVCIGERTMYDTTAMTTASNSVAICNRALSFGCAADGQVAIGYKAMYGRPTGAYNVAIGYMAGPQVTQAWTNYSCLGANSTVTGSNQVQLGDAATTTYAYGAVQNRSDARDKTGIRPTVLGLEWVNKLKPVDFKWAMREDKGVARTRYHHGFIAQDLEGVIKATGQDFGGYQDHSIKGGMDVKSLGYTEFIAPMVRAIQELSAENLMLKGQLASLAAAVGQMGQRMAARGL